MLPLTVVPLVVALQAVPQLPQARCTEECEGVIVAALEWLLEKRAESLRAGLFQDSSVFVDFEGASKAPRARRMPTPPDHVARVRAAAARLRLPVVEWASSPLAATCTPPLRDVGACRKTVGRQVLGVAPPRSFSGDRAEVEVRRIVWYGDDLLFEGTMSTTLFLERHNGRWRVVGRGLTIVGDSFALNRGQP
jgi:hypothetical protein